MKRTPAIRQWARPLRSALAHQTDQEPRPWFRIENAAAGGGATDVYLFDEIGASWFGGISSDDFVNEVNRIDTPVINLHLDSPGGDVFSGVAIYNTIRQHPATVNVFVDGLAASIASVIAMAGDTITMNPGTFFMVHEASGLVIGNAADMRQLAAVLDKISGSIAGTYAARAGGTSAEWREAMLAETWYTAEEAVEAGLADDLAQSGKKARAAFDLSVYGYESVPVELLKAKPRPAAHAPRIAAVAKPKADMWDDDPEICILPGCQNGDLVDIDICREHLAALFELREPGEASEAEEMAQSAHAAPIVTNAAGDDCCPCCEERECSARACDGMCDEGEDCCDEMDDRQAAKVAAHAPAPTLAMSQFTQIMREAMASR